MAFSLTAVFGIDATGVKAELRQLKSEFRSFIDDTAKLGAGLAVGAFVALSKGALDLAASLKDTAGQIGINVESLQALHFAATQNGSSIESMDKALEKLRLNVEYAKVGNNEYAKALQTLGLTQQQLAALPLEKQYVAIGRAYAAATDKAAAYNAVNDLFGKKIGPDQMNVLAALATDGFPKTAKAAAAAGQVMSAETIVALEKASQAIDDFKKRATIAVGNILVNFRSEDGLYLLGLQFAKVVFVFGAQILDAIVQGGELVWAVFKGAFIGVGKFLYNALVGAFADAAKQINKLLPDKLKIDVQGIEQLKVAGNGISDEIARAISQTQPTILADKVAEVYDGLIAKQKLIVDAANHVDFGPQANKLKEAGKALQDNTTKAADAFNPVMQAWSKNISDSLAVAKQMGGLLAGIRGGSTFNDLSDEALQEVVRQNRAKAADLRNAALNPYAGGIGASLDAGRLEAEALNAQSNLDVRNRFRSDVALKGVEGARRDFDPVIFEKLLQQFGPGTSGDKTVSLLQQIQRDGIPVRPITQPSPIKGS